MLVSKKGYPELALLMGSIVGLGLVGSVAAMEESQIRSINWRTDYKAAAEESVSAQKPLLIQITADWCGACRQMKQLTFSNHRIKEVVDSAFIPLVIDADKNPDLVAGFQITAFPTNLVVAPDLKILKRFTGFQSANSLLPQLELLSQNSVSTNDVAEPASAMRPENFRTLAFEGFCLVSLQDDQTLRKGEQTFTTIYNGQEVYFHSEQHLGRFLANPKRYWPVADGTCLVSERDEHEPTLGDPRLAVTWRGRLWLFTDRDRQRRFIEAPHKYLSGGT